MAETVLIILSTLLLSARAQPPPPPPIPPPPPLAPMMPGNTCDLFELFRNLEMCVKGITPPFVSRALLCNFPIQPPVQMINTTGDMPPDCTATTRCFMDGFLKPDDMTIDRDAFKKAILAIYSQYQDKYNSTVIDACLDRDTKKPCSLAPFICITVELLKAVKPDIDTACPAAKPSYDKCMSPPPMPPTTAPSS